MMIVILYIFLVAFTLSIIYYFNFRNDIQGFKKLIKSIIIEVLFVGFLICIYPLIFKFCYFISNNK
jgi:hypothetical protein